MNRPQPSNDPPFPEPVMVVLVTVPDANTGEELARAMVEARLAACANILPGLTSIYRWEGEIRQDSESLIIFKTTEATLPLLKEKVLEFHPYEVPEFLALSVADGHRPYLHWVGAEVER